MNLRTKTSILLLFCALFILNVKAQFVTQKGKHFYIYQKPYYYIGANYWYGGYLAFDTLHNGKKRLQHELDFLQKNGVTNLRVLLSGEGDSAYHYRISPALQIQPNQYNETILQSFDYLLEECRKRKLKIVGVFNNNWEWSGGMAQYLEWMNYGKAPLPKTPQWDWNNYCTYIAQFYTCDGCQVLYKKLIQTVVTRVNTINGIEYKNDPTIMAWQLANEPRPMQKNAIPAYINWIEATANYIKMLDQNHLVSIGVEGSIGTAQDTLLFEQVHQFKSIDYTTIHIWPKTWQWYNGEDKQSVTDTTLQKTIDYILQHERIANRINKPLVIEEFGLHRDGNDFSPTATVKNRNIYYTTIYQQLLESKKKNKTIAGTNFWGFAGLIENITSKMYWQYGMPYSADPPQEEQGLYSVFETDKTTWQIIRQYTQKIK